MQYCHQGDSLQSCRSSMHRMISVIMIWCDIRTDVTGFVIVIIGPYGEVKAVAQVLINDVDQDVVYYAKLALVQWSWSVLCATWFATNSRHRNGKWERRHCATAHGAKWSPPTQVACTFASWWWTSSTAPPQPCAQCVVQARTTVHVWMKSRAWVQVLWSYECGWVVCFVEYLKEDLPSERPQEDIVLVIITGASLPVR